VRPSNQRTSGDVKQELISKLASIADCAELQILRPHQSAGSDYTDPRPRLQADAVPDLLTLCESATRFPILIMSTFN